MCLGVCLHLAVIVLKLIDQTNLQIKSVSHLDIEQEHRPTKFPWVLRGQCGDDGRKTWTTDPFTPSYTPITESLKHTPRRILLRRSHPLLGTMMNHNKVWTLK